MAPMAEADDYDYELPRDRIAQEALADRAAARLLAVRRSDGTLAHRHVCDLPSLLRPGDLLVVNDTRVVPARLVGRRKTTGGRWEGLFLNTDPGSGAWHILAHTRGRPALGERIVLVDRAGSDEVELELLGRGPGGTWLVRPETPGPAEAILQKVGRVPLPGYIRGGEEGAGDVERYQTVFARQSGSAAAPTAGLHFTQALLEALQARGVGRASVTLHVGIDTFRPISVDRLEDHPMHTEWCCVPEETAAAVRRTRQQGGRVVAVGTTAVRSLETAALAAAEAGATEIAPFSGPTALVIRPGFVFRATDCLLTNFHLPRSTLFMLVSAFSGLERMQEAYAHAIASGYRFYSYGDACLLIRTP